MQEIPFSEYLRLPEADAGDRGGVAGPAICSSEYFTSREWFRLLADTCLGPGETAVVHRLHGGSGQVIDLPLRRAPLRGFGLRGYELHALANFYSSYYAPPGLAEDPSSRRAIAEWASALGARRRPPDRLVFRALDEADGTLGILESALRGAAFRVERFADFGNWSLPCDGLAFGDYWQGRPGRLRSTVRRKLKALEREHAIAFRCFDRPQEAEEALRCYETVQAAAWQPPEPHKAFLPELIRRGLGDGSLLVWILQADARPIAAQIWSVAAGKATIFKLAYDSAWKHWSPGTLLIYRAIECALDSGTFALVDFGRGDDHYKSDWMTTRLQRWGLAAYSKRTLFGLAIAARNLGPKYIRGRPTGEL
ncbi:MAG: GNAT family N-acetyltransferase [Tistlia sp.]|uniref:GNAT family N-acetyltransferase n=1 Tax=Tistlia sp. TaxID=3057121 RepID=UPI0034A454AF